VRTQTEMKPQRRNVPRFSAARAANRPQPASSGTTPSTKSCSCGGGCPRCQAKSKHGATHPGDATERHADGMAERALRGPVGPAPGGHSAASANDSAAASSLSTQLNGRGVPLDPVTRGFFESRFQTDLTGVRVHTGAAAASLAHSYEAHAFTFGRNIVFNAGEYSPHTHAGKRLLAHELAHVQQQRHAPALARQVMRTAYAGCDKATTGVDDPDTAIDEARRQAKRMIARARKGFPRLSGSTLLNVHRHFHCPSNQQIRDIMKNLELIEQTLPTLSVQCVSGKTALCKTTATTRGQATSAGVELCPAAFREDARDFKFAGTLINGAALTAGFANSCGLGDACYDDFTIPADVMMGNAYSYTWFVIQQSGFDVAAPPTIPCSPSDTGENVNVPPSAATNPSTIRPLTGYDDYPAGSLIKQVFSDRSGNRFIYDDNIPGSKAYTADGRKRFYLP
jgi:hypothetical protein